MFTWTRLEFMSCVKVEVDVLGSPSPIDRMVSVCGRKATLNRGVSELRSCVKVEVDVLYGGLWGHKATLNRPDTLHYIAVI